YFYNVKPSEYYGVKVQYHSWTYFYLSTASYDGQLTETLNQTYSPPDGTVAGQVNDYCGGTVWRPQVDLYQGSTHIGNESTNSGDFSFTVPAGSYSLQAERSSYTSTSASVSVNPDVTTTKNFTLRRYDREIKVSVTNTETGNAAQGVAVTVSGGGISKTLDTGWGSAAGTRVFDDLLPGYSYTVSVNNGTTGVVSLNCSTTRKDINLTYTPPDS
ncbi:MAG: carboxypeptidase-like regulatory domain-containing protein, partial [bacterium]